MKRIYLTDQVGISGKNWQPTSWFLHWNSYHMTVSMHVGWKIIPGTIKWYKYLNNFFLVPSHTILRNLAKSYFLSMFTRLGRFSNLLQVPDTYINYTTTQGNPSLLLPSHMEAEVQVHSRFCFPYNLPPWPRQALILGGIGQYCSTRGAEPSSSTVI